MSELLLTILFLIPWNGLGNERRVEIEMRPLLPENIRGKSPLIQEWAKNLILSLGVDVKHTNDWDCSMCGKPSRETKAQVASWTHLCPPRIVVYIHHLCEAARNPCHKMVMEQAKLMNKMGGLWPEREQVPPKPDGVEYPLAAGCLGCQTDESSTAKLSRCARCRLVRYCGTQFQANDWPRHKKVCKHIKRVKWVNWD